MWFYVFIPVGVAALGAIYTCSELQSSAAAAILLGLGLHALLDWWWADPLASLVIVVYGVREGRHAWAESAAYAFP